MSIGTLLVYGTLRPGNPDNIVVRSGYKMFDLGAFPGVVCSNDDSQVVFERIEVLDEDHLADLDRYEGCRGNTESCLYHRIKDGEDWVYVYNRDLDRIAGNQVESGDWLKYSGKSFGRNKRLALREECRV